MWSQLNGLDRSFTSMVLDATEGSNEGVSSSIHMKTNFFYPPDPTPESVVSVSSKETKKMVEETHCYSRHSNPNFQEIERKVCALHGGEKAFGSSSGMGAISAVICSLMRPGKEIVCSDEVYHDVHTLLKCLGRTSGLSHSLVDITNTELVIQMASKV